MNYLYADQVSSTMNTSGGQTSSQLYYPYGDKRGTGSVATPYRYTGQRWEDAIGLYFYNARWYDPALGRFIQPDTIVPEPGNPQALNRYSYVLNNPIRYNDPTGHWTEDELVAALGEDWYETYFGEGKAFEGKDNLLEFLRSDDTRSKPSLHWVREMFENVRGGNALFRWCNPDAIGFRLAAGGKLIPPIVVGGDVSVDVILNISAGELSYFLSGGGGFAFGGGTSVTAGYTMLWNMPSNDAYRGRSESIGVSAAAVVGGGVEMFMAPQRGTLFIGDPRGAFSDMWGMYGGVGVGAEVGGYDVANVAYEVFRQDATGGHWINFWKQANALTVQGVGQ